VNRVVIASGGTGGHLFPAISIAEELKKRVSEVEILFAGEGRRGEAETVGRHGYSFERIPSAPLRREFGLPLRFVSANTSGFLRARRFLKSFAPDLVVATGGYACAPVGVAAWRAGIPLLLQEQNCLPGLTFKLLARVADRICLGFEPDGYRFKRPETVTVTGNPLRPELLLLDRELALDSFKLEPDFQTVLVSGGSQGAKNLNTMIVETLDFIEARGGLQLVWQTGEMDFERCREAMRNRSFPHRLFEFIDKMGAAYSAADLVVCRSGALTLSELGFMGKPSLLVPYPFASEGHQYHNARHFQERGASVVVLESEFRNLYLVAQFKKLVNDPELLRKMGACAKKLASPEATERVVTQIRELSEERARGRE
jgi:UDP-N-acetylglucosamine--N-acetylmuramyl-(pentapeptide) pyrophosphoryl-undecaprenol N-acetylglucosamine transferase